MTHFVVIALVPENNPSRVDSHKSDIYLDPLLLRRTNCCGNADNIGRPWQRRK